MLVCQSYRPLQETENYHGKILQFSKLFVILCPIYKKATFQTNYNEKDFKQHFHASDNDALVSKHSDSKVY